MFSALNLIYKHLKFQLLPLKAPKRLAGIKEEVFQVLFCLIHPANTMRCATLRALFSLFIAFLFKNS